MAGSATEARFEGSRLIVTPAGGKPQSFDKGAPFRPTAAQLAEYAGTYTSEEFDAPAVRDVFTSSLATMHFTRHAKGTITGAILNEGRILNMKMSRSAP